MLEKFYMKVLFVVASLFIVGSAAMHNASATSTTYPWEMPFAGDYYDDVPSAKSNILGAAQNFHIFARSVEISAHTNGNIATQMVEKNTANWGSSYHGSSDALSGEIFYIENFKALTSNPFLALENRPVKFVVGKDVVRTGEFQIKSPYTKSIMLDSYRGTTDFLNINESLMQDQGGSRYIDFEKEFSRLSAQSQQFASKKNDNMIIFYNGGHYSVIENGKQRNYKAADQQVYNRNKEDSYKLAEVLKIDTSSKVIINLIDQNNSMIELKNAVGTNGYVYVTLPEEFASYNNQVKIFGLDSRAGGNENVRDVIFNFDVKGRSAINLNLKVNLYFGEDRTNGRSNREAESFADSTILWNIFDSKKADLLYRGSFRNHKAFQGTILLPNGTVYAGANIDGSIIAKKFVNLGNETHRWDFQGERPVLIGNNQAPDEGTEEEPQVPGEEGATEETPEIPTEGETEATPGEPKENDTHGESEEPTEESLVEPETPEEPQVPGEEGATEETPETPTKGATEETPVEPETPEEPQVPGEEGETEETPEAPTEGETEETPGEPKENGTPGESEEPKEETPEEPVTPEEPQVPGEEGTSEETPEAPTEGETEETPGEPKENGTPGESEEPTEETPVEPVTPEEPIENGEEPEEIIDVIIEAPNAPTEGIIVDSNTEEEESSSESNQPNENENEFIYEETFTPKENIPNVVEIIKVDSDQKTETTDLMPNSDEVDEVTKLPQTNSSSLTLFNVLGYLLLGFVIVMVMRRKKAKSN